MNDLMIKVIDQITFEPQTWHQGSWIELQDSADNSCGTTCCVAGWAMLLSGQYKPEITEYDFDEHGKPIEYSVGIVNLNGERTTDYERIGANLLDLTEHQANVIFMATGVKDPQAMVNLIKETLEKTDDEICEGNEGCEIIHVEVSHGM